MALTEELRQKITGIISGAPVVLFMKGNRRAPQCGFSAKLVQVLDGLVDEYHTVDVLSDQSIREGIKEYSDWPTIPQLYVKGEFLGGTDIVAQLYSSGELQKKLGVDTVSIAPPKLTLTDAAAKAIRGAQAEAGDDLLHLSIDGHFQHQLDFSPRAPNDLEVSSNGIELLLNPASAKRANGLIIDFVEGPRGSGFKIDNPNAPAPIRQVGPKEVKAKIEAGEKLVLVDVRTEGERAVAKIDGFAALSDAYTAELERMDKATPLYFLCHHGGRSQRMAEHFRDRGYRNVHNIAGGIDAWAREADSQIPRY